MPGFTAPKLLWVRRHEPAVFSSGATRCCCPKAYVRYRLTGEMIEEMSDASGTLVARCRRPRVVGRRAGGLRADARCHAASGRRQRAGWQHCAGNSRRAGAWRSGPSWRAGQGTMRRARSASLRCRPGDAFVSLGAPSGVLFAASDRFRPYPQAAVHAFCHAIPGAWHQMGVTLSAAASLAWWAGITARFRGGASGGGRDARSPSPALFLPYLGGERTPHNDPTIRGAFAGLSPTPTGGSLRRRCWRVSLSRCATVWMRSGFGHAHRSGGRHRRRLALTHMDRHHCRRAERSAAPFAGGRTWRCFRRCAVGSDGRHR